eukprot:Rhum_TRINITY_DN14601_c13_g1::Rhum_TRINITY_DN14601_c13_g1_i1::g.104814::m.104814
MAAAVHQCAGGADRRPGGRRRTRRAGGAAEGRRHLLRERQHPDHQCAQVHHRPLLSLPRPRDVGVVHGAHPPRGHVGHHPGDAVHGAQGAAHGACHRACQEPSRPRHLHGRGARRRRRRGSRLDGASLREDRRLQEGVPRGGDAGGAGQRLAAAHARPRLRLRARRHDGARRRPRLRRRRRRQRRAQRQRERGRRPRPGAATRPRAGVGVFVLAGHVALRRAGHGPRGVREPGVAARELQPLQLDGLVHHPQVQDAAQQLPQHPAEAHTVGLDDGEQGQRPVSEALSQAVSDAVPPVLSSRRTPRATEQKKAHQKKSPPHPQK